MSSPLLLFAVASVWAPADLGAVVMLDEIVPRPPPPPTPAGWRQIYGPVTNVPPAAPPPPPPPLAVALLHPENGTVKSTFPPFGTLAGGISGQCNAAFDPKAGWFYKVSGDGVLLTIDPRAGGQVVNKVTLSGGPDSNKGGETFLAGPDAEGLLYTAVPLSYTTYNILSYNTTSGQVKSVSTQPKGRMDGLGVCVGFVLDGALYYVFKDDLVKFDLVRKKVTTSIKAFPAPVAVDPAHPGSVLAITDGHKGNTSLSRFDLGSGVATELYTFNSTYYEHLCHCHLPLRAQDQADLAISADGKTAWTVLSYNDKPTHHESLITRGVFVLSVGDHSASLTSSAVAWKEKLPGFPRPGDSNPRIGNMAEIQV